MRISDWSSDVCSSDLGFMLFTRRNKMAKILVLYYSMYGHIETMANSIAEGARSVSGVAVTIKRVPETMKREASKATGARTAPAERKGLGEGKGWVQRVQTSGSRDI